jgi:PBP1b-binding outer membrane lipoprotein LpoB
VRRARRVLIGATALLSALALSSCGSESTSVSPTSPVTTSPVTTSPVTTSPVTTSPAGSGITEQEIADLEQQLDEIDALLSGIENDLADD